MAEKLQEPEARMELAVQKIAKDSDLRFYIRSLLNAFGYGQTPGGSNALDIAQQCGRHSCAMEIIETLLTHDPQLFPKLISEDLAEQIDDGGNY